MLITKSSIGTYQTCPRKYELRYHEGWNPAPSEEMRLGTLVHRALEELWAGRDPKPALKHPEDPWLEAKARAMVRGYVEHYGVPEGAERSEETWEHAIPDPDDPNRVHPTARIAGKWDSLHRGWVVEHKATSWDIGSDSTYWDRLDTDYQVTHYALAALMSGEAIEGVLYDVLRVPAIRPLLATPEDKRKYRKDGQLYANQRTEDETVDEFYGRLVAEIDKDPERYYRRRKVQRMEEQYLQHVRDLWRYADLMERGPYPRNTRSCVAITRKRCPFFDVCHHGLDPAVRPDLFHPTPPHAELASAAPWD